MYWTQKHVLACTASHCAAKGANDVLMLLRREVLRRGLDKESWSTTAAPSIFATSDQISSSTRTG